MGSGLLEREDVVGAIRRLVARLGEGRGGALFVLGEAGLGKTSVLDLARQHALELGHAVGSGQGHPMETGIPFGLAAQALAEAGGRGLLDYQHAGQGQDRAARLYAVLRWLEAPGRGPVLFVFDDIHWADADSLALAVFACRRLGPVPAGLIATARPWPATAAETVLGLAHDRLATVRRLAPLSERAAAAALAGRLGAAVTDDVAARAFALTAGNPLLLDQVARAITEGTSPTAGEDLLLSRFAGLPPTGMRCAQAAAVLGSRFLPAVAAEIAGLTAGQAELALESLDRSGLIGLGPRGDADFTHPLFRQALYEQLPGLRRGQLHARAFTALVARGQDAQAAEHAIQANLAGDQTAIAVMTRAGLAARRAGALETAVRRLEAAVALAGDLAGADLLLGYGDALLASGRSDRAVAVYQGLVAEPRTRHRVTARWMLGRALVLTSNQDRAAAAFDSAVGEALPGDPATAVAVLLDWAFSTWLTAGPGQALPIAARAADLAAGAGPDARASAESVWAHMALQTGDPAGMAVAEAAAATRWAGPLSDLGTGLGASLHPLTNFGYCALLCERFGDADRVFTELLTSAERALAPEDIGLNATVHAWVLTRTGRLDEALAETDRALTVTDLVPMAEAYAYVARGYIQLYRGELADSDRWYQRAHRTATERGQWNAMLFLSDMHGVRCLRAGQVALACEAYDQLCDIQRKMGIEEPCLPPWALHGIAAYLAAGRRADVRRILDWLDDAASRLPCRFPRIAALTGRAWLAEQDGDRACASALFERAVALHAETDLPLERAETLLAYGGFLRRDGQPSQARAALASAISVAESAGAGWLVSLATDELRVAGGRRRRAAAGLTAAEQRVAALAGTGATNRDIARQLHVAVRTIETHLERVYAKLGLRSRGELIAKYRDVPRC